MEIKGSLVRQGMQKGTSLHKKGASSLLRVAACALIRSSERNWTLTFVFLGEGFLSTRGVLRTSCALSSVAAPQVHSAEVWCPYADKVGALTGAT